MNCLEMLKQFIASQNLGEENIALAIEKINKLNETNPDKVNEDYSEEILASTITDSFKLNAENLKEYSDYCIKNGLQIGRRHKKILLNFLNYRNDSDKELFFKELSKENKKFINDEFAEKLLRIEAIPIKVAFEKFKIMWNDAVSTSDNDKIRDYVFGLYSKIHAYYNSKKMSNVELFEYNLPFIKGDMRDESISELKDFCYNSSESFYDEYVYLLRKDLQKDSLECKLEPCMNQVEYDEEILKHSNLFDRGGDLHYLLTEEYDAVYLKLNQKLYDSFKSRKEFLNYVLDAIQQSYILLINNKVFCVEIDNIYEGNRNIKWLLYSYVGIYSERFIQTREHRKFFSPEKICDEMFNIYGYEYSSKDEKTILNLLKKYYSKNEDNISELFKLLETDNTIEQFKIFLEEWAYVYYGFSFNDCYILRSETDLHVQFSKEVKNDNKILFVFYKYRMDERKTPCPVCNGLNVSGNSYPEIGHRSWECKNVICSSRSKSNRGKRYSFKTNFMQFGAQNPIEENIISKELISKWRKDIANVDSDLDIYYMFIKYFSFSNEKILFINTDYDTVSKLNELDRELICISKLNDDKAYCCNKKKIKIGSKLFDKYFEEGNYINRFFRIKTNKQFKNIELDCQNEISYVFNGDSFEILNCLPKKCVSAAVTSPPYFNAREYSQWPNMYLYYIDMFNIVRKTLDVLDNGGVFVYNIGDINGNEMTIAKSNMGTKRMLLGAYSILMFEKAGYELVDNYIWNKGEPQSKRSTNDGNFTPHYQKPVNCYEHMFIFKKCGDKLKVNSPIPDKWKSYITEFTPVYKINSRGENKLGHTDPYPEDVPELAIKLFGKHNKYIIDPFLGSGTTVIAANKNGYNGIGIEFSKEYTLLSRDRIKEECPSCNVKLILEETESNNSLK